MTPLWYSTIYTDGLHPAVRFPRQRYRLVRKGLEAARAAGLVRFHDPRPMHRNDLLLVHDADYIDAFLRGTLDETAARRIGLRPWTDGIVDRTLVLTNGTIEATRHVLEHGGMSGNVGGGTHHAHHDFGSGYCIFNDLALAARTAQRDYGVKRVLVLDLDVHQGDGTAAIFHSVPTVRTVSLHCGKNFPFRKMQSDLDLEFPPATSDDEYLEALEQCLARELDVFEPDLILYQAGVDGLGSDRLGFLHLTHDGLRRRNSRVFAFARQNRVPLVVTMGGGYSEPIGESVRAHLDLFLQVAGRQVTGPSAPKLTA